MAHGKALVMPSFHSVCRRFRHSSTHPRYVGLVEPLISTSWRNRPLNVGWFGGVLWGDDLVRDRVAQKASFLGGYRLGWDFDHYWGTEWRLGWAYPDVRNRQQPLSNRGGRLFLTDLDVLYYPWGDSRLRPYFTMGMGLTRTDFRDTTNVRHTNYLFSMPFGLGMKHHWRRWLTWRVELMNNLAFGSGGTSTLSSVSLTFGADLRLGVRPGSFWPWRPSRHTW